MTRAKTAPPAAMPHRLHGQIETFARELHSLRQRLVELDQLAEDHLPRLTAPPMRLNHRDAPLPPPAVTLPGPIPAPDAPWWQRPFGAAPGLRPAPGFRCAGLVQEGLPVIAVSCCGLAAQDIAARIDEIVQEQMRSRGFVALFLTDAADQLHQFRHQGLDVELLPTPAELAQVPGSFATEDFLGRRLRQIRDTWGICAFRDLGARALPWPAPEALAPAAPLPRIVFYKDYRRYNPYQHLLYMALPGFLAEPGEIAQAELALASGPTAFHLNWEEAIYRDAPDAAAAQEIITGFLAALERFCAQGGKLIWTLHNETPHEDRFPAQYRAFARRIAELCDLCIVHSAQAGAMACDGYGLAPERLCAVPHGGYHALYPATASRGAARKAVGLPAQGMVFGFVGVVRPYKNVPLLIEAFNRLPPGTARLLIAGRHSAPDVLDLEALAGREDIVIRDEVIPEARLSDTIRACDAIVLPFDQILTSGSMMLALSHGVPVIVPAHPSLCETLFDRVNGLTFPPGDAEGLAQRMADFIALSDGARIKLGERARISAKLADWDWIGRRLSQRIEAMFAAPPGATPPDQRAEASSKAAMPA